ncbi:hypothetical protein, variant [Puccinia triticina 1-1 BBBD Race 1]|uniref:Uncharacterized protein n=1 Tax=Puccinia triticina (isolate 1-1 / race 1 (BBBD)) TaxID=630390 RepID=A0A180GQL0_PUCT1|nr:hypothetical protein, variant [Puccinia triticina 1-1 BBBD Race 1]
MRIMCLPDKALQTADRINLTLQPTLNLFTDSLTTVNRQLETVGSQAVRQSNIQDNQGLLLAKLEKDVRYLTIQANEQESRLAADKNEHMQMMCTLQNEFDTLNSSLAPIALMAPLLQAFLESQLRSSSNSKEPSGWCNTSYGQTEVLEKTVTRHSSAINMRSCAETRSLKRPETQAHIPKPQVVRPDSSVSLGKVRVNKPLEDSEVNVVQRPVQNESDDTQITRNQEPGDVSNKVEAEQEPTTTQASENQLYTKGEVHGRRDEVDERLTENLQRLPSSVARKSMSRRRSQIRPNSTQQESNTTDLAFPKAQSRKRTRSRTPTGLDQEHIVRSKSISYTQLRKISSQPTALDSPGGTAIPQDCHQSYRQSNQVIKHIQAHSTLHKVRTHPLAKDQDENVADFQHRLSHRACSFLAIVRPVLPIN